MDFVYICKSGDNEELRYSIRSVINSFPEAKVWLVGGKPNWYSGDFIEVDQRHHKYANAINNLQATYVGFQFINKDNVLRVCDVPNLDLLNKAL